MKWAVVTGASRGIGSEVAIAMSKAGYHLVLVSRTSLQETAQLCDPASTVYSIRADVTDLQALREGILSTGISHVSALVCNAGIDDMTLFRSEEAAHHWHRTIQVNLLGVINSCLSVRPLLRAGSTLVIVSSQAAHDMYLPGVAAYAASKAGVRAFAQSLFSEVQHEGIKVSVLSPGLCATQMGDYFGGAFGEELTLPPHQMVPAAEVARTILYVCSQDKGTNVMDVFLDTQAISSADMKRFLQGGLKSPPPEKHAVSGAPVAFVTGASSGIGEAMALALARRGYALSLVARNEARLEAVKERCLAEGAPRVMLHFVDVKDLEALRDALALTKQRLGRLTVSVANAGINRRRNVLEADHRVWREVVDTNMTAALEQMRVSAQIMVRELQAPHFLVNVNSQAALGNLNAQAGLFPYYASKSGVFGGMRCIWEDVRSFGLKCVSIYPGLVDNPLGRRKAPIEIDYSGLISSKSCADALLFALDSPEESCPTLIHLREQHHMSKSLRRIVDQVAKL